MQYLKCHYSVNNTAMMGMKLLICSLKQPENHLLWKPISFDGVQFSLEGGIIPLGKIVRGDNLP